MIDNARGRLRPYWWAAAAVVLAILPFSGGFSATRVFFVRDLGAYFWPRHLWLRQMWHAGEWPWWDPFAGAGQSAVADALNQFFLLPVTLLRLVTPDVVGFNLWVAAPFPLLAVGMWLWLRRWTSPFAAWVGAGTFTLSGPVLSSGNFPNYSWTVALIPWVLCAVDRVVERRDPTRLATLAAAIALQALAGEPVTLAVTAAVAVAYAVMSVPAWSTGERVARAAWVTGAGAIAALLAAVQLIPLAMAAARSPRGSDIDAMFWSLHPLALVETLTGHLFGHAYDGKLEDLSWMTALNGGREPLLFSLYAGVAVAALAMVGSAVPWVSRWRRFWCGVAVVSLIAALGEHTPVYRTLHDSLPFVSALRFPIKYFMFTILALSVLAATGAEELLAHARRERRLRAPRLALAIVAAIALATTGFAVPMLVDVSGVTVGAASLARTVGVTGAPADVAATWLIGSAPPLLLRATALCGGVLLLLLLVWRRHRWAPMAAVAIGAIAVLDPLVVNLDLHPTIAASTLGPPAWAATVTAAPGDRVYIGGHLGQVGKRRERKPPVDAPQAFDAPLTESQLASTAVLTAQFAYVPGPWGLREVVSYDLPQLWPREYHLTLNRFREATPASRLRFLGRVGTRYCFLPAPPTPGATPLVPAAPPSAPMALYACDAALPRAFMSDGAIVNANLNWQLDRLFEAATDLRAAVAVEQPPPAAAGSPGNGRAAAAQIVHDGVDRVVVAASVPAHGGYLNLTDSYDPWWRVEVDGAAAPLLRANGMFRAVRLAPGEHRVVFRYRPVPLYAGAAVSTGTALALLLGMTASRQRKRYSSTRVLGASATAGMSHRGAERVA